MVTDTSSSVEDATAESETDEHANGESSAEERVDEETGEEASPSADTGSEEAVAGDDAADTETGLDANVAGALSYLLGPFTGILFYVLEPEDAFVRFHAVQSTAVFGGLFVASIVLTVVSTVLALIPVVGWIAAALLGLGSLLLAPVALIAWVFLMYKAYNGEEYEVPLIASTVRKYATPE